MRASDMKVISIAALLAVAPALWAPSQAQTTNPPTPSQDQPAVQPTPAPAKPDRPTMGKTQESPLVGLEAFSADGQNMGKVTHAVVDTDGKATAIHIKVGGLLGFGGKTVAIPAGKFALSGKNVRLGMTADDINKLPAIDTKG